jgi:hypothetical protein
VVIGGEEAQLGLRVPEVHLVDRDGTHYPADLAIVEDFPGEDLMGLFNRDPRGPLQRQPPASCAFKVRPRDGLWSVVTCAVHSSNLSLKAAHLRK